MQEGFVKTATSDTKTFAELAGMLEDCSQQEQQIFNELYQLSKPK